MKYKLINRTKISTESLHGAIQFCAPKGITDFTIIIEYSKKYLWYAISHPFRKKKSVHIWVNDKDISFPRNSSKKEDVIHGYTPLVRLRDEYELYISLLAHELRHIWQGSVSKRDFTKGKINPYVQDGIKIANVYMMERDACKYVKKIIQKYRKL